MRLCLPPASRPSGRSWHPFQATHPPRLPRRLGGPRVVLLPHPADCCIRGHAVEHRQRGECRSRSSSTTAARHLDDFTVPGALQGLPQRIQSIQPVSRNPEVGPGDPPMRPRRRRPLSQRQQKVRALMRNLIELPTAHPGARRQHHSPAHSSIIEQGWKIRVLGAHWCQTPLASVQFTSKGTL